MYAYSTAINTATQIASWDNLPQPVQADKIGYNIQNSV